MAYLSRALNMLDSIRGYPDGDRSNEGVLQTHCRIQRAGFIMVNENGNMSDVEVVKQFGEVLERFGPDRDIGNLWTKGPTWGRPTIACEKSSPELIWW